MRENVVGPICPALEQFADETANLPTHRFRAPLVRLPWSSGVGFLFTSFSQAFKDGHLTKLEMFYANALGAVHNCCAIDARLRLRLLERTRRGGALSQRLETRIIAQGIKHRIEPE
jgi:hypothetical protein